MTLDQTLRSTTILLAISLLIQSLEMRAISLRLPQSAWTWDVLAGDWQDSPAGLRTIFFWLLNKKFKLIIYLQMLLVFILPWISDAALTGLLLLTALLISMRFRGLFNGGSDSMTLVVLIGMTVAYWGGGNSRHEFNSKIGFYYIAAQVSLSYFTSGIIKLKQVSWRKGLALQVFLKHSQFVTKFKFLQKLENQSIFCILAWGVILWEISAPIIWFQSKLVLPYMIVGICFHLINFIFFGLNRFFWAWMAAYPALYYCTQN